MRHFDSGGRLYRLAAVAVLIRARARALSVHNIRGAVVLFYLDARGFLSICGVSITLSPRFYRGMKYDSGVNSLVETIKGKRKKKIEGNNVLSRASITRNARTRVDNSR